MHTDKAIPNVSCVLLQRKLDKTESLQYLFWDEK